MTYGVYTSDLKASYLKEVDLETARRYRHGDRVICTERMKTFGFEVSFAIVNYWQFRIWWHIGEARLGFLGIKWRRLCYKTADKIVEGPKEKEVSNGKQY